MKKQRLISRLVAGSLVLLLPVLSLSGCTSNQNQVSAPTSPEQLGYTIDQQQIPQVVMEDSVFLNQETFYCPELSGDFTAVGAYWHDYLGSDAYPVAFLQAVPANTTKIKLPSGEISVSDWVPDALSRGNRSGTDRTGSGAQLLSDTGRISGRQNPARTIF